MGSRREPAAPCRWSSIQSRSANITITSLSPRAREPRPPRSTFTAPPAAWVLRRKRPLDFGTIPFGTTEMLLLTINNIGVAGTVTIGTQINGPSYKILTTSQNTCLAGISAGQSCTLPVEFDPVAVGNHNDHLTLTPSSGARPPGSTFRVPPTSPASKRFQRPAPRSGSFFVPADAREGEAREVAWGADSATLQSRAGEKRCRT